MPKRPTSLRSVTIGVIAAALTLAAAPQALAKPGHPHLHYEQAYDGSASWGAANTERVRPVFNGVEYGQQNGQTNRNTISKNC